MYYGFVWQVPVRVGALTDRTTHIVSQTVTNCTANDVCVPCRAVNWFTLTESAARSPSYTGFLPVVDTILIVQNETAFAWQSRPEGTMNGPVKIVKSMICLSSSQRRHSVKLFNWILIVDNYNNNDTLILWKLLRPQNNAKSITRDHHRKLPISSLFLNKRLSQLMSRYSRVLSTSREWMATNIIGSFWPTKRFCSRFGYNLLCAASWRCYCYLEAKLSARFTRFWFICKHLNAQKVNCC